MNIESSKIPDDSTLRRWHPKFLLNSAVPKIQPSPLPVCPSDLEQKVTSAKEAVKAFQARALFCEADACQNIANLKQVPNIPSPKKSSVLTPHKSITSENSVPITPNLNSSDKIQSSPVVTNLKGVSMALLQKVSSLGFYSYVNVDIELVSRLVSIYYIMIS